MSGNPFRELPDANPYASPSSPGQAERANPLLIPAVCLLVLSGAFFLLLVLSLPVQVIRLSNIDTSTPEGAGELAGGIAALVAWMAVTLAIIIGSIGMLRFRGYSGALTAAILAIIPICSPCLVLGIPFGIWAVVVLLRPEVRGRFRWSRVVVATKRQPETR